MFHRARIPQEVSKAEICPRDVPALLTDVEDRNKEDFGAENQNQKRAPWQLRAPHSPVPVDRLTNPYTEPTGFTTPSPTCSVDLAA